MRRIFIKAKLADKLVIDGSDGFHLSRVMRAKIGDHIVVADDVGQVGDIGQFVILGVIYDYKRIDK